MGKLRRVVEICCLALVGCIGGSCAKQRCKSEAPAFEVTLGVPKAWDGEVTKLEVEVALIGADGGTSATRQRSIAVSKELLKDGATSFWVTVGPQGASGFVAALKVTAMAGSAVRATASALYRGNANACNFFTMALGTSMADGQRDGSRDGPLDLGQPREGGGDHGRDLVTSDHAAPKPDAGCPADKPTNCSGVGCVDTQTNPDYCGNCTTRCSGQRLCIGGKCYDNGGCTTTAKAVQRFSEAMWGCAHDGTTHGNAGSLCAGPAFRVCKGAEWVSRHGTAAPSYNYWVSEWLDLDTGSCFGGGCTAQDRAPAQACTNAPALVCAGNSDPLNNGCSCWGCGWGTDGANHYFGGCNPCPGAANGVRCDTAGTLCCR